ncbi:hypothetical protein DL769_010594 [Monosporascus sp. CRB-8-3]|nr:hypothetical protein DL769_010594 [Monosporascus sp. CRB-8-3]
MRRPTAPHGGPTRSDTFSFRGLVPGTGYKAVLVYNTQLTYQFPMGSTGFGQNGAPGGRVRGDAPEDRAIVMKWSVAPNGCLTSTAMFYRIPQGFSVKGTVSILVGNLYVVRDATVRLLLAVTSYAFVNI